MPQFNWEKWDAEYINTYAIMAPLYYDMAYSFCPFLQPFLESAYTN